MRRRNVLLMPSPVSSGSVGTVAKALGIARLLRDRGCDVCFAMGGELGDLIARQGFAVAPCPVPRWSATTQPIRSMIDVLQWTGLADEEFVQAIVRAELDAIRVFQPDVIFAETRPSAAISAAAAGVPLATIASWPTHPAFPANQIDADQLLDVFNRELIRYTLPEVAHVAELLFLRSQVQLSPSLPELEPELQSCPDVQFVGYMLDLDRDEVELPAWYRAWRSRPLIFIYLSVGAIAPERYLQTIPAAFDGLPFDVLCACGFHFGLKTRDHLLVNDQVCFVPFIPAQLVVPEADLIIFHGGQDTMLMALLHSLPSIAIPGQHFERAYNAAQLARFGAAKQLPVHAFRPHRLRQVVSEVLAGPYADASRQLASRLSGYGGTAQGVEAILSLI